MKPADSLFPILTKLHLRCIDYPQKKTFHDKLTKQKTLQHLPWRLPSMCLFLAGHPVCIQHQHHHQNHHEHVHVDAAAHDQDLCQSSVSTGWVTQGACSCFLSYSMLVTSSRSSHVTCLSPPPGCGAHIPQAVHGRSRLCFSHHSAAAVTGPQQHRRSQGKYTNLW